MNVPSTGDFEVAARQALVRADVHPPRTGEVVVVLLQTPDWLHWLPAAMDALVPDERARAARFRFEADRTTYALAHAVWRILLGHCLGVARAAVPLQFSRSGQPQLPGTPLATSLSHSGEAVLLGVGRVAALGVDIEGTPPRMALRDLISTLCTPDEAAALRALPDAAQEPALLQLWTRKEALLKAFGTGLAQAPASIAAPAGGLVAAPPGVDAPACRARDLCLPAGWLGAWAAPASARCCRLHVAGRE